MKTKIFKPFDPIVKGFIEFYVLAETSKHTELKTIPNGRVDASIVIDGKLEWFFESSKKFELLSPCTLYPPTRNIGRARLGTNAYCIGIKFYPHILALPVFENLVFKEPISFKEVFKTPVREGQLIRDLKKASHIEEQTQLLDTYFLKQLFLAEPRDHWILDLTHAIEAGSSTKVKIRELAKQKGVSIKTLERRFLKLIGLTPKLFSTIVQLHGTARNIRKKNKIVSHGDIIEALGNGYYDQSHFIRSCKRITGLSPKKLFTRLPDQMTDLLIEE